VRTFPQHVDAVFASAEGASEKNFENFGVNLPKIEQVLPLASDLRLSFEALQNDPFTNMYFSHTPSHNT